MILTFKKYICVTEVSMDYNIKDVSGRLKSTREYLDISVGEMASKTNVSTEEYI